MEAVAVAAGDRDALRGQLQDYIAGMTAFVDVPRVNGAYAYPALDDYWRREDHWPFWAVAEEQRAGFALVRRDAEGAFVMAEFYVRPEFRRAGVGLGFARQLLARFPGTWILSEFAANTGAVEFWHRAIAGYAFTERFYVGGMGSRRLEQRVSVP